MIEDERILKEYYKIILLFVTQMMFLTLFVTHNFMKAHVYIPTRVQTFIELILGLIIFVLCFVSIYVVKKLYKTAQEQHMYKVNELKYKNIEEQNKIHQQHKHDLLNHLHIISGLAMENRLTELNNYLADYQEEINSGLIPVNTGLREMDYLLYSKISVAQRKNIVINYKCATTIECRQRFVISLISILGNLLDNAIEAAKDLKEKRMTIYLKEDPIDYLFIVKNTFENRSEIALQSLIQEGISTKGADRGKGLWIVKKLVDKFEGKISLDQDNGLFVVCVELPKHTLQG